MQLRTPFCSLLQIEFSLYPNTYPVLLVTELLFSATPPPLGASRPPSWRVGRCPAIIVRHMPWSIFPQFPRARALKRLKYYIIAFITRMDRIAPFSPPRHVRHSLHRHRPPNADHTQDTSSRR